MRSFQNVSEQDHDASQLNKTKMHDAKSLKSSCQTAKVVQPGKETFHLPTIRRQVSVKSRRPSRSSLCLLPFRDTVPDATHGQILPKGPAVISLVRSKTTRTAFQVAYLNAFHSGNGPSDVVTASIRKHHGQRQTVPVYDGMPLAG